MREEDNLVQATSVPTEPQNGQLNAVPTGKTMGQIGRNAYVDFWWLNVSTEEQRWEAAANAVIEECAKIAEAKAEWILSRQDGKCDGEFGSTVDLNLRMMALILPDVASEIRSLKSSPGRVVDRSALPNDGDQRETKNLIRGEE
jgi:hypothetical protein